MALAADETPHELREMRHFAEINAELAGRPITLAAFEVRRDNFAEVLAWLPRVRQQFSQVRFIGLIDGSLVDDQAVVGEALLEAGVTLVTTSPRRLEAICRLVRHQTSQAGEIAENSPLVDQLWAALPWQTG